MIRGIALFAATLGTILLAAAGQSAEVVGTIVSTDPTANTVIVSTPDGRQVVYRTVETTRIQQGDTTVELKSLQPGSRVQITTTPAPQQPVPGETTVVYPVASGIVIAPTEPPKVSAPPHPDVPKSDIDVDIDRDVDDDDDD
jgi:hypothetical protein